MTLNLKCQLCQINKASFIWICRSDSYIKLICLDCMDHLKVRVNDISTGNEGQNKMEEIV